MSNVPLPLFTGPMALLVRRIITSVVFIIALLSFAFGFGNGWKLGLDLGIPGWIAPLVAPAVDLSVIALLASVQYLRASGVQSKLAGPRILLVLCGLMTFALNTAKPVQDGAWGRACFDAIAPTLLIGWSEVGPRLLALLHSSAVPDGPLAVGAAGTVRDGDGEGKGESHTPGTTETGTASSPGPGTNEIVLSPSLLARARRADAAHRKATGKPITRDKLRAELKVSNAVAGEAMRRVRADAKKPRV
jgi:hypothetical protein